MRDLDKKALEIAQSLHPPKSQEDHKQRIETSMLQQCREQDAVWLETGVDTEVLDASIEACDLKNVTEF